MEFGLRLHYRFETCYSLRNRITTISGQGKEGVKAELHQVEQGRKHDADEQPTKVTTKQLVAATTKISSAPRCHLKESYMHDDACTVYLRHAGRMQAKIG